ncbi:MAG: 50S ribosomal protein L3 [Thermoplasmataceae archaeon]
MATPHHPRRGSMGYYPRVRSKRMQGDIRSWPEVEGNVRIQAFAGYKVGMTHVEMTDYRKFSTTAGQTIAAPVTVVEVPPLTVAGIRYYDETELGLSIVSEKWSENQDKEIFRRITKQTEKKDPPMVTEVSEVRFIVHTNPKLVSGVPSKVPDIFEVRIVGGDVKARMAYAEEHLGKDLHFSDFSKPGNFADVIGVTKGKGFQGHVKRFGVKLLPTKNRKHRRMIGTLGPWHPDWVRNTVPQAGQIGTHQRTAHNIRILKYSKNEGDQDINVKGGFTNYGLVRTEYVLVHGSVPGAAKRLIKFRDPARQQTPSVDNLTVSYVSKESKQGD